MKYVLSYFDKLDLEYIFSFVDSIIDNKDMINNEVFNNVLYLLSSFKERIGISLDCFDVLSDYVSQRVSDTIDFVELEEKNRKIFISELISFLSMIQDLLDINASEEDKCIGEVFELSIYNIRLNSYLIICIKKEKLGWFLCIDDSKGTVKEFNCNKSCSPELYEILDIYGINYPNDLKGYFEWLWNASTLYNWGVDQVREEFFELNKWINVCNDLSPKTKLREYR